MPGEGEDTPAGSSMIAEGSSPPTPAERVFKSGELMGEVLSFLYWCDLCPAILALVPPHLRPTHKDTALAARKRDKAASLKMEELIDELVPKASGGDERMAGIVRDIVGLGGKLDAILALGTTDVKPYNVLDSHSVIHQLCTNRSPYNFTDLVVELFSHLLKSVAEHTLSLDPDTPQQHNYTLTKHARLPRAWWRYRKVTANLRKVFIYLQRSKQRAGHSLEEQCLMVGYEVLTSRFRSIMTDEQVNILQPGYVEVDRVLTELYTQ